MTTDADHQLDPNQSERTLFDRTFRDRDGNIVIAQKPNLPILVGTTAAILQLWLPNGELQTGLALIAFGTLFTWAWEELFQGVNYFRRAIGLISLVSLVALGLHQSWG